MSKKKNKRLCQSWCLRLYCKLIYYLQSTVTKELHDWKVVINLLTSKFSSKVSSTTKSYVDVVLISFIYVDVRFDRSFDSNDVFALTTKVLLTSDFFQASSLPTPAHLFDIIHYRNIVCCPRSMINSVWNSRTSKRVEVQPEDLPALPQTSLETCQLSSSPRKLSQKN